MEWVKYTRVMEDEKVDSLYSFIYELMSRGNNNHNLTNLIKYLFKKGVIVDINDLVEICGGETMDFHEIEASDVYPK